MYLICFFPLLEISSKSPSSSPLKSILTASRKVSTPSPKRPSQGGRRFSNTKSPRKEATPPPPPRPVSETETDDDDIDMQTDTDNEREVVSDSSNTQVKDHIEKSDSESGASITDGVRSRLKRLGALYSG